MKNNQQDSILVIGVGNTLRSDDGVGHYVCEAIEGNRFPGVRTLQLQQLQIEVIPDLAVYRHLLLVDASIDGAELYFGPAMTSSSGELASSHHAGTSLLSDLGRQLYQTKLDWMICSIRGENFDMGETLSPAVKKRAEKAIGMITDWIAGQIPAKTG